MNPTGLPSGLSSLLPIAKPKTTIPPPLKATAITPIASNPTTPTQGQPATTAKGKPKTERKRKAPEDKEKKPRAPKAPADPNAPKKPKKVKQPGEAPAKPRKPKDGNQSPSFLDDLDEFSKEDGLDEEEAPPKEEEEDEDENLFEDDDISTPDKARVGELLSQFSPDQQSRYEYYRRSALPRSSVKKLMMQVSGQPVTGKMAVVMSGISKVFVGEIVETARTVMEEWKESGSLKPRHIREAYRRLKQAGKIPYAKPDAKLFKRVY